MGVPLQILVSDDYQYSCPLPGDWRRLDDVHDLHEASSSTSVKAAGMTGPDVRWELWNEADYSGFWKGTQAQWLETWKHAYEQVRAAIPDAIIEGPSLASGAGGSAMNAFLDYCQDQQRRAGLHHLARSRRRGRSGGRPGHDQSRAFEPRNHGRERFRPQRIWVDRRAEPGPLRLVPGEIRSGGHRRDAQQLGRRIAVLFEHGGPRGDQLAAEQPVLDLQALRGSDRPSNQRHGRNAGGRRGVSGCVRGQIHHRGG